MAVKIRCGPLGSAAESISAIYEVVKCRGVALNGTHASLAEMRKDLEAPTKSSARHLGQDLCGICLLSPVATEDHV